jgi:N-acetylmuramoyl-L-alanine amidase
VRKAGYVSGMMRFSPDSPVVRDIVPSPNHGVRKDVASPDSIILHYTGMPTGESALAWLCDPASQVSCHYFVWEDGRVTQLVPEERRAWHAGRGFWAGASDLNSHSIGIEIVNPGHEGGSPDFPTAQIEAVIALCADICARRCIAPQRILAHSDIAPARKRDPGEKFPWDVLGRAGVGHWRSPEPIAGGRFFGRGDQGQPVEALQAMLALYGYGIPVNGLFCEATEQVVGAFQRHFRPERVDGVADVSTITTLRNLIAAQPAGVT